jgi:uncharacterized integral membrane protein
MKRSTILMLVPVAAIAAVLAVANREPVVFKLDPFAGNDSAAAFVMPLYLLVFLSFLLGVLVGGATVVLRRARKARRNRIAAADIADAVVLDAAKPGAEPP